MSLSTTLDVAIGLIGLYLALSVIASALLEFYRALLSRPARLLRWGIGELFNDPMRVGLAKAFYAHPLIRGLTGGKLPSEIDPKLAARVLVDLMDQAGVLEGATATPVLAPFIREFGAKKEALLEPIADWFKEGVNRLGGIAARRSQAILLALGVVTAVAFNIDSVEVARALATQEPLRELAVAEAKHQLERTPDPSPPDPSQPPADPDAAQKDLNEKAANLVADYSKLPIGWPDSRCRMLKPDRAPSGDPLPAVGCVVKKPETSGPGTPIEAHWLGWLVTAIAISLGAQFWYRLLGQLIKLRGASPMPAENKPEEK